MTAHRASYPALRGDARYREIEAIERGLDDLPRQVIPTATIRESAAGSRSGDVLAFATGIEGLDVTHTALAHRGADGELRVLHAPLSGGTVEVTRMGLHEYVSAIRGATGILVARPLALAPAAG